MTYKPLTPTLRQQIVNTSESKCNKTKEYKTL